MKKRIKNSNASDIVLALSIFQKKHPYTEILGIYKERYTDLVSDKEFDVYVFKTNKSRVKIRIDNIKLE